jgi:hypothetical protein
MYLIIRITINDYPKLISTLYFTNPLIFFYKLLNPCHIYFTLDRMYYVLFKSVCGYFESKDSVTCGVLVDVPVVDTNVSLQMQM